MKCWGRGAVILLFVIMIFPLCAEEKRDNITRSKQPAVESVDVSPIPVGQGDIFTMTIIVDHENSSEVEFPLDDLPGQIQLWRGPYIRSFIDTDENDLRLRKVRITTSFKPGRSGRMIFPGLNVIVDNKKLKTEPFLLSVGLYRNRKLYIPIETEWRTGFDEVYAGEAVPVYLVVRNLEAVNVFDRVRVAYPDRGIFEEIPGLGSITSVTEGDIVLFDVPAAGFIYTATEAGEIKIPSAGVDYNGLTGWSDNLYIDVQNPPEELKSGAVGSFTFNTYIDEEHAEKTGEILLTCIVEGHGNLNYLKMPDPEVNGAILVSTEENIDFKAGSLGYSGKKAIKRTYSADSGVAVSITVPDFDFLDKESGTVKRQEAKNFEFTVRGFSDEAAPPESPVLQFEKKQIDPDKILLWKNHYRNIFMYIWLVPGPLFFIISWIFRWRRLIPQLVLTVIIMVAAVSLLQLFVPRAGGSDSEVLPEPDVFYNNAIEIYNEGDLSTALHLIRSAIYIDPFNNDYRLLLSKMEDENGFVNPVNPSIRLHPDLFFYILVFIVNIFFAALFLRKKGIGSPGTVVSIFSALIILVSAFMIYYTDFSRSRMTGVCADGSSLRKIPKMSASRWISVENGTAVRIVDETDGFLLIETGLGVKGWVEKPCIMEDRYGNG